MMGLVDMDSTHTKFIMLAVIYQVINMLPLLRYFYIWQSSSGKFIRQKLEVETRL